MKLFFLKIFIILIATITPLKIAYCEVFIVAKVNQEIITNLDVDFEERYLVSLNPSLKKLDQNRIFEYAKKCIVFKTHAHSIRCHFSFPMFIFHPKFIIINN